jgi:hypothetical protein
MSWRAQAAADARTNTEPPNLCYGQSRNTHIWQEEKAATHRTATPNEHGVFAEPVYYDWHREWDRVRVLLGRDDVQAILKECVNLHFDGSGRTAGGKNGYYIVPYERHRKYPWYHQSHSRLGNGEQDNILKELLTGSDLVAKLREEEAQLLETIDVTLIDPDYDSDDDENILWETIFLDDHPEWNKLCDRTHTQ